MNHESLHLDSRLSTPRAAAVAGVLFSVLSIAGHLLIRSAVPQNPLGSAADIIEHMRRITLALNLVPFAGIAFLWFIAVLRDRLGKLEDRFFATVLLGSGLLYVALFFVSAAIAGGVLRVLASNAEHLVASGTCGGSRGGLSNLESLRHQDGGGVYVHLRHDSAAHRDSAQLVRDSRLCPGAFAFAGHRHHCLDADRVSCVGAAY